MSGQELAQYVDAFRGKVIGVIGDVMLDRFVFGDARRLSPEAPIPVVRVLRESVLPGGAANVASNIAALGARAVLVGVIGKDRAGVELGEELRKRGIRTAGLCLLADRPTTEKTRIVARGQQMVRLDCEYDEPIPERAVARIVRFVRTHMSSWQAVVISDYAKGVFSERLAREVIEAAALRHLPVLADVKPGNAHFFKQATLLTPNHQEAALMAGTADVLRAGAIIQKRLGAQVLITQGADGMTLFTKAPPLHFPAKAREVFDVTGAGDTVQAVLALALASGLSVVDATTIANHAAGIVVGKVGTAVVLPEELTRDLQTNGG
ncbi:MAG: D-glycero-beta-D-manno-heptose-7-phosphate kinase [bacterium]|nr:D-glycero-beta-D-manno-heptose-7-phosphate kinase [bacterium]MDZ4296387.1 D-glycero-beta-D-manno-heptose-7-phosphate kinase [Patescibacteria group bacterium]